MKSLDYKPPMIIADNAGFSDPSFVSAVGNIVQGVFNRSSLGIGPAGLDDLPRQRAVQEEVRHAISTTPRPRIMQGFLVLADAIDRAGSTEPAKIQRRCGQPISSPASSILGYQGRQIRRQGPEHPGLGASSSSCRTARPTCRCGRRSRPPPSPSIPYTRAGEAPRAAVKTALRDLQSARRARCPMILVQVIVGGLLLGAVYALFSSGLTLIWGMMNVINFAHGDFVMLGMYVAFLVVDADRRADLAAAVPIAALVLATLGIVCLLRPHPPRHARADAGADSRHLRAWRCCCAIRRSGISAPISAPCRRRSLGGTLQCRRHPHRILAAARGRASRLSSPSGCISC